MGADTRRFISKEFNKAKKKANRLIDNGYDTSDIVKEIKAIRKTLDIDRPVLPSDIAQHLAIKIAKGEVVA